MLACATLGGLSSVQADPPAVPPSTQAAESSTPAAVPGVPASTAAPAASNASIEEVAIIARRMRADGYREEMHQGVKQWCREEVRLGSRLSSRKVCATPAQLDQIARDTQNQLKQQLNLQTNPSSEHQKR